MGRWQRIRRPECAQQKRLKACGLKQTIHWRIQIRPAADIHLRPLLVPALLHGLQQGDGYRNGVLLFRRRQAYILSKAGARQKDFKQRGVALALWRELPQARGDRAAHAPPGITRQQRRLHVPLALLSQRSRHFLWRTRRAQGGVQPVPARLLRDDQVYDSDGIPLSCGFDGDLHLLSPRARARPTLPARATQTPGPARAPAPPLPQSAAETSCSLRAASPRRLHAGAAPIQPARRTDRLIPQLDALYRRSRWPR